MSTLFGGRACADPAVLYESCRDEGLPLDWWGKANLFRNPLGRGPGTGAVLLTQADLDALDLTADHTLSFDDDRTTAAPIALTRITLLRAKCLTPGYRDDSRAVYLCELADRRHFLTQTPCDKAYNVRNADGDDYLSATLNGSTAWTWAEVVEDLWAELNAGTVPTLPFTPDGTPENLRYHAGGAWDAVNDVLDRIACAVKYDPVADAFTFVRLGDTTATGATTLAAALANLDADPKAGRTWDAYHLEPDRGRLPEKVRVLFPRRPVPTDGSSPWYAVNVTLTATTGVAAGTYVQLRDDLTAIGAGTPTNAAALTTRAAERAADWRRKRVGFERRLTVVYRDFRPEAVPGETVQQTALDDHGGPMVTVLESGPDGAMERWGPWAPPLGADAAAAAASLATSTLLPCPIIDTLGDCCTIFVWCQENYDCYGQPFYSSDIYRRFGELCPTGLDGVVVVGMGGASMTWLAPACTLPTMVWLCDFPSSSDPLDPDAPGACCTPTGGSVMESDPHAGECEYFPPCLTIAGENGTDTFSGITFTVTAQVNLNGDWPVAYTAPGGNFYVSGVLTLCPNAPVAGWYFVGTVRVYNPADGSSGSGGGSGSGPSCGCVTTYGGCPTVADYASQEIVAFHLGDKTETLRLTTACGTLDLSIEPCASPPPPVYYGCVSESSGTICEEMVGGPFLNDPTCGGFCTPSSPPPPPVSECCDGAGEALETPASVTLRLAIPDGPNAGTNDFSHDSGMLWLGSGGGYGQLEIQCVAGVWSLFDNPVTFTVTADTVSCLPFGLVFSGADVQAAFGCVGDVTVVIP